MVLNKLVDFFFPPEEISYFEKLKTNFFIKLCLFGISILSLSLVIDPFFGNENFAFTFYSKSAATLLLLVALFILKYKGIKIAGNFASMISLILLLVFVNIIPENVTVFYKYMQGFYSIFVYLIMGLLFATRPVILINAALAIATTTRVYIYSTHHYADKSDLFTTAYIQHTVALIAITIVIYYTSKFMDLTINRANKEIKIREQQNTELLTSEEEIRASNEELVATSDALVETIEELRFAKEKAEESDRLKTEFLTNMSHEVRTPMNGIIGFSQLLDLPDLDDNTRKHYSNTIQQSSNQLLLIIDNIIEISKLGTKQVKVHEHALNLNAMLSELFSIFSIQAGEKNISLLLKNELGDDQSNIISDELKIYKIISNLLENAIKFTEKGKIEFGYTLEKEGHGLKTDAAALRFFVKDTGIGILEEHRELIFAKFSQADANLNRQYGGLGLGLSIAKENTELLGGEIELHSEFGKGTTFYVTLPYKKVITELI